MPTSAISRIRSRDRDTARVRQLLRERLNPNENVTNGDPVEQDEPLPPLNQNQVAASQLGPDLQSILQEWDTTGAPRVDFFVYLHLLTWWGDLPREQKCYFNGSLSRWMILAPDKLVHRRPFPSNAQLKVLLEELYKDKEYLDMIIAKKHFLPGSPDDKLVLKDKVVFCRENLITMALIREMMGPLPPRP